MKKKRLNFKDDFEMIYLRHDYIEKINKQGLKMDSALVQKYAGVVHTTAKMMFYKLKPNFEKVGFQLEDFVTITNMYMLTYMALYSVQTNEKELNALVKYKGRPLTEEEIVATDRNRLINFLRQKLTYCSTLFARKARNITVGVDKRGFFAKTDHSVEVAKSDVVGNHKEYGYRKVTAKEYKAAKQRKEALNKDQIQDKNGFEIFRVEKLNNGLSHYDYAAIMEGNKGEYYHSPETALQISEENEAMDSFRASFQLKKKKDRRRILNKFIDKNKDNPHMTEELSLARKMLRKNIVVL
jgi:hypothetical protein